MESPRHFVPQVIDDFLLHIEDGDLYISIPSDIAKKAGIIEGSSLSLGIEQGKITLSTNSS